MTEQIVKKTQKEYFDNFVALYGELATLNEDIKQLSESLKEDHENADVANIKAVAKLQAEQKLGDKLDKNDKLKEVAETFVK